MTEKKKLFLSIGFQLINVKGMIEIENHYLVSVHVKFSGRKYISIVAKYLCT